jgi:glycosyltransferase involved in cell wall biosynthesis
MASALSLEYDVEFIHDGTGYTVQSLGEAFGLDMSRVRERIIPTPPTTFEVPGPIGVSEYLRSGLAYDRALTNPYDLFVFSGHSLPPICYAKRGLVYQHFPIEGHPLDEQVTLERWKQRSTLDRGIRTAIYDWIWNKRMRSYQQVLVNSRFTAAELERRWRRTPTVLYPPVALEAVPKPKRNVIASVGRFDARDGKNIRAQVEAFPRFLGQAPGNWSYCSMGFCGTEPEDIAHVNALRVETAGLPMTFLANAGREVMLDRLCESKIFWHTRGLAGRGAAPLAPRHQEHFGIATVEAMMAGCVPMVPRSGGQPEIVQHGESGFLCDNVAEMVEHTVRLAKDEAALRRMGEQARERSQAFSAAVFDRSVADLVRSLIGS